MLLISNIKWGEVAVRSKEATKTKILDAAKVILARDGFEGLKINNLADEAGVGKPLIYRYFSGLDGVVAALAQNAVANDKDGGQNIFDINAGEVDGDVLLRDLLAGGRGLASNRLSRDLLLWSLASDDAPDIAVLGSDGGDLPEVGGADGTDGTDADVDRQATYAILKAAIAFVVLYRDRHDSWAGLPIKTPNNMARMERALAKIVSKVWG
ncbi:MAG: TetR/AcrR family transcriptional regulator [Sphingomonadales bacterium]|nr:TetR/AcrR family transcriptional regulator [Sphingomonadales bacterium]